VALFLAESGAPPRLERTTTYLARDFGGLDAVVRRFLAEQGGAAVAAACFGVAGPVHDNRASLTNLGWEVDGGALGAVLGVRVELVNDLVATALGMALLTPDDLLDLNPGAAEPDGNGVLLGAGTGLGMALLVWSGDRILAVPSEGGHVDLAARDEEGWRLRQWLSARLGGRVSVERVASGTGLRNLFEFLLAEGLQPSRDVARRLAAGQDAGQVIGEAGLAGSCPVCVRALDLFASFLGAVAGDMALVTAARGGVYLGGGVSVRLADKLADGTFLRAFLDKGRHSFFVERVPVRLLLRPDTALWGAGRRAAELAGAG
jgi:glucokinase